MPDLDRFYREAANKAAVLAVAPGSSEGGLRDLVMKGGYSFPIMLDDGGVASAYKVRYVPALFVIDAAGNLVQRLVGGTDFAQLNKLADGLNGG
jgi:hypothetical protein